MRVAVMGAGGVGGYVGGRLFQAGFDVTLIARGAHMAAMRANGLSIETPDGSVHLCGIQVEEDPGKVGTADLVIFTVKLNSTEEAAAAIKPLMGDGTRILTLQNGIDSKAILERHYDRGRVASGVIYVSAHIVRPGVIKISGGVHLIMAEALDGDPVMENFLTVGASLPNLSVKRHDSPNDMVWGKFIDLVALSGATCLTRSPIGSVRSHPYCREFLYALLDENVRVARSVGIALADDHAQRRFEFLCGLPGDVKSSMLVDLEAARPLELHWLSAKICELGGLHEIATPANRAVVAALSPFATGRQIEGR